MSKTFSHGEILHDSDCINLKGYFINADPPSPHPPPPPGSLRTDAHFQQRSVRTLLFKSLVLFTFDDQILASKRVFIINYENTRITLTLPGEDQSDADGQSITSASEVTPPPGQSLNSSPLRRQVQTLGNSAFCTHAQVSYASNETN